MKSNVKTSFAARETVDTRAPEFIEGLTRDPLAAGSALDFSLRKTSFRELDLRLDAEIGTLWCHLDPNGPPSFTPSMVRELNSLHRLIRTNLAGSPASRAAMKYYVQGSRIPGIYNMGGDLSFLTDCIRRSDREAVRAYALGCVQAVYDIATGFDCGVVTIGLVQGDALGGGLEGALCCNVIFAERSARMGLPEILFNSFPGMGAYSFLARRIGMSAAEKMIMEGKICSAQEMCDLGVIDFVVDDGCGEQAVLDYVASGERLQRVRQAIFKVRQRINAVTLAELRDVTEIWVDITMQLGPQDLRRMERLQTAQDRRLSKVHA